MSWLDGVWRALLSVCNMGGQWWNVFSLPSMRQFRFHEKLSEPPWSIGWVTPFSWGCPYPKWCSLVIRLWLRNCEFLRLDYRKTAQLKPIWDDARFSISFFPSLLHSWDLMVLQSPVKPNWGATFLKPERHFKDQNLTQSARRCANHKLTSEYTLLFRQWSKSFLSSRSWITRHQLFVWVRFQRICTWASLLDTRRTSPLSIS